MNSFNSTHSGSWPAGAEIQTTGSSNGKNMGTPVQVTSVGVEISQRVENDIDFNDDNEFNSDAPLACNDSSILTPDQLQKSLEWEKKNAKTRKKIGSEDFSDQIKIDFIPSIDYRIMCRFVGATTVNDIKNHPYQAHPLITLILMESLEKFMKSKGFSLVGELNFDAHGNSIPPRKKSMAGKR